MGTTPIRDAVVSALVALDQRLRNQLELPPPSRQPLLDPSETLLAGDLAVVGARHDEDAEHILLVAALDSAAFREVLLVVQDARWSAAQLLSIASGIATRDLVRTSNLTSHEIERVKDAERTLTELPLELAESRHKGSAEVVEKWLQAHTGGLAVLPAAWPASLGHDEEGAAEFVRTLKAIARSTEGTIMIPWHVNASRRLDARPRLHDLAVSGAAEDDADLVVLFHESDYGVELRVAKNRHGAPGYLYDSRNLSTIH